MFARRIRVSLTELVKYNDLQEIINELWGSMLNKQKKNSPFNQQKSFKIILKIKHYTPLYFSLFRVKSAQQIMGSLVKDFIPAQQGVRADRVYHISVMPCFDKVK